jgi:HD-GYP domain-containing protein (c-di-GMP phosphodiesterase class II)
MEQQRIVLAGVSPQCEGRSWQSDTILRIGRLNTLEVFLDDASISRRHAEVLATDQGWVIHDLGSMNGTYLNSARLGRTDRRLHREDVIQCGKIYLVVTELARPARPPSPKPADPAPVSVAARRRWDRAVGTLTRAGARTDAQSTRLLRRLCSGYHLCHAGSLAELLTSVLEDSITALDARQGTIILADAVGDHLDHARAVSVPEQTGRERRFSRTLVQRAFTTGESMLSSGPNTDESSAAIGLASTICALLRSPRRRLGVLYVDRGPGQAPFDRRDLALADAVAAGVSVGIESMAQTERQRELFLQTVAALAQAIELRDCYTGGHTQRVTAYSLLLAKELGLTAADCQTLQVAVPLHDIGKIGIPDQVLAKPGGLTEAEVEVMRTHVAKGLAIVEAVPDLGPAIPIIRSHHERWDGRGYPEGLSGEQIPLLARIVAVADAFDAMTSDRPYRCGMPLEDALEALKAAAGTQFDPDVVAAFTRLRGDIERLLAQETDLKRLAEGMPGTSPNRPTLRVLTADLDEAATQPAG